MDPGEIHVSLLDPDVLGTPEVLGACERVMSEDERTRLAGMKSARRQVEYRLTRALVRRSLSVHARVAPTAWRFEIGPHGRPEIAGPGEAPKLFFNVSHTAGLIACAVAVDPEIGVDVEDVERRSRTVQIADRFFAPSEVHALGSLPVAEQRDRFFDYWTLKESYIKARGKGLAIPLKSFAFDLSHPERIGLTLAAAAGDVPDGWRFFLMQPDARHRLALAVRPPTGVRPLLRMETVGELP